MGRITLKPILIIIAALLLGLCVTFFLKGRKPVNEPEQPASEKESGHKIEGTETEVSEGVPVIIDEDGDVFGVEFEDEEHEDHHDPIEHGASVIMETSQKAENKGEFKMAIGDGYTLTVGSKGESGDEYHPLVLAPKLEGCDDDVIIYASVNFGELRTDAEMGNYIDRDTDPSGEWLYVTNQMTYDTLRHASELRWGNYYDEPAPAGGIVCNMRFVQMGEKPFMMASVTVKIEEKNGAYVITGLQDNSIEAGKVPDGVIEAALDGALNDMIIDDKEGEYSFFIEKVTGVWFPRVMKAHGKGYSDQYDLRGNEYYCVTINGIGGLYGYVTMYLDTQDPYTYRYRNPLRLKRYEDYTMEIYKQGF